MEDTLSKFMSESAKRHEENSNLIKEIRASMDAVVRNQGASIKNLEIQIEQVSKNRTLMYESRQTTISFPSCLNGYYCKEKKGSYGPQFSETYSKASLSIPQREKDPGVSLYLPLLIIQDWKYPKGIAKNVLVRIGKFVFLIDFIIIDMPEDIKVPLILGRPFLSTARAKIDVYKIKITLRVGEEKVVFISVKHASSLIKRVYMLSLRERMELDLEARFLGETLVLNRSLDHFFEDYIELNDLNEPIELKRNQGDDIMPTIEECESIVTEFAVFENMDAYRDEGMGDVIISESFVREVRIKARRFEGTITLYKDDKSVTYQMVRSHPRFKHHTNKQCNKIPPLLKYLQHEHYALWEVIEFGDSYKAYPEEIAKDKGPAGEAKTTLSLALPDEHQLRFSKYDSAKELWEAILKTFGGNEATKKTKKNQLKQQYGNFKAEGSKTLEQTFNRLQAIVSHFEFMDVPIKQDDLNQKFLTSLAPKWLVYTIVWRNRDNLDTMSLDDVYNHLKVYKPEIDEDDIEGMNIKWNLALLSMWADRGKRESYKKDPMMEEPAPKAMLTIDESMLWHRRFSWTFFLKSKDETSRILRNFITEIENLKDLKVKIIKSDNEGEFRNKEMDEFCSRKGIKREFSNARTPQQNGVAERRNKTLIEAA
uniref:Putative ribonuclease H-like domain-containing protein n=1 Tax=Tanacetum cinerariifolium TaxID=118510 RepID=A0A6L2NJA3_TANCI|nr:putative ribonuclease H-like domain-containing protein [Tanacetum cinerariifolium]